MRGSRAKSRHWRETRPQARRDLKSRWRRMKREISEGSETIKSVLERGHQHAWFHTMRKSEISGERLADFSGPFIDEAGLVLCPISEDIFLDFLARTVSSRDFLALVAYRSPFGDSG